MQGKSQQISTVFEQDHRHCDALFVRAEELVNASGGADALARFEEFAAAMERHFQNEETNLFPLLEEAQPQGAGPTQVMRREHLQMRQLMAALADALRAGDTDGFAANAEMLVVMMQQHNLKEEHILYPMCDRSLSDDAIRRCCGPFDPCCEPS